MARVSAAAAGNGIRPVNPSSSAIRTLSAPPLAQVRAASATPAPINKPVTFPPPRSLATSRAAVSTSHETGRTAPLAPASPTTRTFPLPCTTSSVTARAGERSRSNQLLLLQPAHQLLGRLRRGDVLHDRAGNGLRRHVRRIPGHAAVLRNVSGQALDRFLLRSHDPLQGR